MKSRRCAEVTTFVRCLTVLTLVAGMTARAAEAAPLDEAAARFKPYLVDQIDQSVAAAKRLRESMAVQDLQAAQRAWLDARAGWESVETVTDEFFPELDRSIDAWPNASLGFHAVEAKLFGSHRTDALAEAEELLRNLTAFDHALRELKLTAQGLLNGTTKLAFEVGENKADGGESPFSGNSLAEIGNNIAGIKAAYDQVFAAPLKVRDRALSETVRATIARLETLAAVPALANLDQAQLRRSSEDLTRALQQAAVKIGLDQPSLDN